jgi:hypothetical protein
MGQRRTSGVEPQCGADVRTHLLDRGRALYISDSQFAFCF